MHVKKVGDRVTVDFAGSDPAVKGPINAPLSVTASGVYCALKTAVDPNSLIPPNSGCWRTIEVTAPKGSVVNAQFPSPVVYANHEISHRVADMVMGALATVWPSQVMACSQGTSAVVTFGGVDPRSGRRYVSYETIKGGFGARPNKDGINVVASGISNTMNTPVEVLEMAFPAARGALRDPRRLRRRRPVSRRLRRAPHLASHRGRGRGRLAVHGAHDVCPLRPARRQGGRRRRRHADDARRRQPPPAEQGRLQRAGRLGGRHDHAGLGRLRCAGQARPRRHRPRPARRLRQPGGRARRLRHRRPGRAPRRRRQGRDANARDTYCRRCQIRDVIPSKAGTHATIRTCVDRCRGCPPSRA